MLLKKLKQVLTTGIQTYEGNLYVINRNNFKHSDYNNNIRLKMISKEQTADILSFREENIPFAFQNMINNSELCVFAYDGGVAVAHASCMLENTTSHSFIVHNAAYIHYCHVDPNYRGQSIYPMMLEFLIHTGFERDHITNVYISTNYDNISSQKGLVKAGFQLLKPYKTHSFWRFRWNRVILQ